MCLTKHLSAASFVLALTAATGSFAAPLAAVGTLEMEEFGVTPVLSWSWGAANSGNTHVPGGDGVSNFQDVHIVRYTDRVSSKLLRMVSDGTHFDKVTLRDFPTTLEMEDVLISSYSIGDAVGDGKTPRTESISFNFRKYCFQSADVKNCWDIKDNKPY